MGRIFVDVATWWWDVTLKLAPWRNGEWVLASGRTGTNAHLRPSQCQPAKSPPVHRQSLVAKWEISPKCAGPQTWPKVRMQNTDRRAHGRVTRSSQPRCRKCEKSSRTGFRRIGIGGFGPTSTKPHSALHVHPSIREIRTKPTTVAATRTGAGRNPVIHK